MLFHSFGFFIFFQIILCPFQREFAASEKVIDQDQVFYVNRPEEPVSLPVFTGRFGLGVGVEGPHPAPMQVRPLSCGPR